MSSRRAGRIRAFQGHAVASPHLTRTRSLATSNAVGTRPLGASPNAGLQQRRTGSPRRAPDIGNRTSRRPGPACPPALVVGVDHQPTRSRHSSLLHPGARGLPAWHTATTTPSAGNALDLVPACSGARAHPGVPVGQPALPGNSGWNAGVVSTVSDSESWPASRRTAGGPTPPATISRRAAPYFPAGGRCVLARVRSTSHLPSSPEPAMCR